MPPRPRSVAEKVSDWLMAYNAIREEVTPPALRTMLQTLTVGDATSPEEALKLLTQSMNLARVISANDRMSAVAAALLTSGGGARPVMLDDSEV